MSDLLPGDVPRLETLRRYLLIQLAAVNRAIEQAEHAIPQQPAGTSGWVVMWRYTPRGTARLGILHRHDCWMAKGPTLTTREARELHRPGRRIEHCDVCKPPPGPT